jgi:hypothetical protein
LAVIESRKNAKARKMQKGLRADNTQNRQIDKPKFMFLCLLQHAFAPRLTKAGKSTAMTGR